MHTLDFRTLPCPQPVVQMRKFLQENSQENSIAALKIQVDNEPAVENITRYLNQQGYAVNSQAQGVDFILTAHKNSSDNTAVASEVQPPLPETEEKILVFITTEYMGLGDDELGEKLMGTFLSTLPEFGNELWRIVLLNGGVKLATEGSSSLHHLQTLENNGVDVLVCGTCLSHYKLLEKKSVGDTSNMLDIVTSLQLAHKVIRP